MQKLDIFNKKKVKELQALISKQWGCDLDLDGYAILISPKNKLYFISRDFLDLDLSSLRIDSVGSYFGEINEGVLRLSIEGSQIVGPHAINFVLDLPEEKAKQWMSGMDVDLDSPLETGFYIIRNDSDYMGSGKVSGSRLLNYVPKERRIVV